MSPLLTIGITSYNRIYELKRCLNSIKTKYYQDIEILVSEDCSPLSNEINAMVNEFKSQSNLNIVFNSNIKNVGYDKNLGNIIKLSNGKYIFFLSDDDIILDGFLDILIPFLYNNCDYGLIYSPYIYINTGKRDRLHNTSHVINSGEKYIKKHIYDSILFSGLIFKRDYVSIYDSSRFLNYNYFQVYLFLKTIYKYGGYYIDIPSVGCVNDGENAYGISESSGGNEILANRKSALSILEFNKSLIKVIKIFDKEENTNVFSSFEKQYSLHSYSPMSLARSEGLLIFKMYWNKLNELDIKLYPVVKLYYVILLIFGKKHSDSFFNIFKRLVKKE